jgi:glucose-1-phosphate thymidylyltransferase
MKGIVLAGGTGSRLWPITRSVSKQLLPVYDKPLIHYPLGTLFLAGIKQILIITTPHDSLAFQKLLGDGSQYGVQFTYASQEKPNGLAEAFIIGEEFIGNDDIALILGDNIFHGVGLGSQLKKIKPGNGATIFAYKVSDPERYGVVEFSNQGKVLSLEEKPENPRSNYAVPGLYFYGAGVVKIAKKVVPSLRGELEITSINDHYLSQGSLTTKILERGTTWLDTGTVKTFLAASNYVQIIEERQGSKISCLEEISYRNSWISREQLKKLAKDYGESEYGKYLSAIAPY